MNKFAAFLQIVGFILTPIGVFLAWGAGLGFIAAGLAAGVLGVIVEHG